MSQLIKTHAQANQNLNKTIKKLKLKDVIRLSILRMSVRCK